MLLRRAFYHNKWGTLCLTRKIINRKPKMITLFNKALLCILLILLAIWAYAYTKLALEEHEYYQASESEKIQATEYLKEILHPAPENWRWHEFTTSNDIVLRGGRVNAENAKGTIVYVPGFTGSLELSMDVITGFYEAGYNVAGVEYRGQGGSYRPLDNPEKGYVESYALLADEVAQFANHNRDEDLPLFFYSVSKGAHITMRMAASKAIDADGYALIVPMIELNTAPYSYQQVSGMATVFNALGLGEMYGIGQAQWPPTKPVVFGEPHGCNSNPKTAQVQSALFALNPKLRTRGVTIKWLYETVDSSEKLLSEGFMENLKAPVKIFTAGDDRLVSTAAATQFCQNLSQCSITHFEKARHCINQESAERRNQIISEAIAHFESAVSG